MPLTTPRSVTTTARPDSSHTSVATGSAKTREGAGPGSRPGHGRSSGRKAVARSPQGTAPCRSAGPRPPWSTGRVTASNPTIAWTRATPRCTSSSPAPPHSPSLCAAAGSTTSGTNRTRSTGARTSPASWRERSAPPAWSCQCTRSTRSRAEKNCGCSHVRAEATAPSCSASTRTPVATSCRDASSATSRSAVVRTLKQTASTESSAGSKATSAVRSGGGVRGSTRVGAAPRAWRHTRAP